MKRFIYIFLFIIIPISSLFATHNRAGEIVYRHISGYTYEVVIWTYTYTESQADRDELTLHWGDGTNDILPRVQKTRLPNYYYENKYVGRHTYSGPGTFILVTQDPNRNEGVLNIPNSVNVIFALTTTLKISSFLGHNSTPELYNRPIDKAAVGKVFIHNPGAYDPDGDSLSYKMDTCRYDGGAKIPGFTLPPASNDIYVNPVSGDLVWDAPTRMGIYNVALRIEEWRNGVIISTIIRDIQIEVEETDNNPPQVNDVDDICVIAGDTIEFEVTATDPDNDSIFLEATGAPFNLTPSPAQFPDTARGLGTVSAIFSWYTRCEHIKKMPYVVNFKATDYNPEVSLTDFLSMNIKVIGPPVQFKSIESANTNIILKWHKSECPNATGYKIYRKSNTENFTIDECQTGIPSDWGYTLVKTINNKNTDFYIDAHLNPGFNYCYRIVVTFNEDDIEGCPSDKICTELSEGYPVLTKASVLETDIDTGSIRVEWINPFNLDTTQYQGPYRYLLSISRDMYGLNFNNPIIFNGTDVTYYTDENIDTKNNPSSYKLEFQAYDSLSNSYETVGDPTIASTPFLKIKSANRRNELFIEENVPWQNIRYVIYRFNEYTGLFDSLTTTEKAYYRDANLQNLKEYCYKVKSVSKYTADSMPNPIINYSQIICGTPIDTIAPCCPIFTVESQCDEYRNVIKWTMPADSCYNGLKSVLVYYSNRTDAELELIKTLAPDDTVFYHYPDISLAACYVLAAVDSAGNEAICDDYKECIDICSYYELPNIFTPNDDNKNDLYHPYPYKFVESVDMKIYNRWGDLIFETTDPDINWDGTNMRNNKLVPEGVYYYICDVYEQRLTGIEPRNLSGFIHIYYDDKNANP